MLSVLCFVFIVNTCVYADVVFTLFNRATDLDNLVCHPDEHVLHESYSSEMQCLVKCSEDPQCKSVALDAGVCIGCSNTHVYRSWLLPKTGVKIYNKATGSDCFFDSCEQTNQICFDGYNCICDHGYKFNTNTDQCVTDCSTYGNTYQMYEGYRFDTPFISTFSNKTTAFCQDRCSETPECRSFTKHYTYYAQCWLHGKAALDEPSKYEADGIYYHVVRNCG